MISFLKKWRSTKPENELEQPLIKEENHTEEEQRKANANRDSSMELVLPQTQSSFSSSVASDEMYVLRFVFGELPEIESGILAIDGYKLEQTMQGFSVQAFLRNSMDESIELEKLSVVLKDAEGTVIAREIFSIGEEGKELPPQSGMPWRFDFPYESFAVSNGDLSSWRLEFHMQDGKTQSRVQTLDFDITEQTWNEQWKSVNERIADDIREAIIQTEGLVHAIGANTIMKDNGELEVLVALRNSRDEAVLLEEDTVFTVYDATGEVVASHSFDLSSVELPAYSATPYTLLFPQSSLRKQNPDFSEWSLVEE